MLKIPTIRCLSQNYSFVIAPNGKLNMIYLPSTVSTVPMAMGNLAWASTHVGDTCKQNVKWSKASVPQYFVVIMRKRYIVWLSTSEQREIKNIRMVLKMLSKASRIHCVSSQSIKGQSHLWANWCTVSETPTLRLPCRGVMRESPSPVPLSIPG